MTNNYSKSISININIFLKRISLQITNYNIYKRTGYFCVPIFWRHYWTFFQFFFHRFVSNTFLNINTQNALPDIPFFFCRKEYEKGCIVFKHYGFVECNWKKLMIFFHRVVSFTPPIVTFYFQFYCYLRKFKLRCLRSHDFFYHFSNWTVIHYYVWKIPLMYVVWEKYTLSMYRLYIIVYALYHR